MQKFVFTAIQKLETRVKVIVLLVVKTLATLKLFVQIADIQTTMRTTVPTGR